MSDCKHCHGKHSVERHSERKPIHEAGGKCEMCDQKKREDHLLWAKKRALAYLPGDPGQAIDSMTSDLLKHPAWRDRIALALIAAGKDHSGSAQQARWWIEGWN